MWWLWCQNTLAVSGSWLELLLSFCAYFIIPNPLLRHEGLPPHCSPPTIKTTSLSITHWFLQIVKIWLQSHLGWTWLLLVPMVWCLQLNFNGFLKNTEYWWRGVEIVICLGLWCPGRLPSILYGSGVLCFLVRSHFLMAWHWGYLEDGVCNPEYMMMFTFPKLSNSKHSRHFLFLRVHNLLHLLSSKAFLIQR